MMGCGKKEGRGRAATHMVKRRAQGGSAEMGRTLVRMPMARALMK